MNEEEREQAIRNAIRHLKNAKDEIYTLRGNGCDPDDLFSREKISQINKIKNELYRRIQTSAL